MQNRVAVVGVSQTRHTKDGSGIFYESVFEATRSALNDAGLDRGEIDNVVLAGYDLAVGRTISNMYTAPAAGGYLKDEIRVGDDGLFALALGYMRVLAGFDVTLVCAYGISSEAPMELVSNLIFDPLFHREFGISELSLLALQASAYMQRFNITHEDAKEVVLKNRKNGLLNPDTFLRKGISERDINRAKFSCWPLRVPDIPQRTDASVAIILASEEIARRIRNDYLLIEGIGWSNGNYYLGDDLTHIASLRQAARKAYRMAGIKEPLKEIDLAEVSEMSSFHELMVCEALGFCDEGEAAKMLSNGEFEINGRLPVNPSGGLLCSYPGAAAGLVRAVEVVVQLRGEAGRRQIKGARRGLAHGRTGIGYQGNCVVILRNPE